MLSATVVGIPTIVNVSREHGPQAEGAITVDPVNPSRLVAASNESGASLFLATSRDSGHTWSGRQIATGADFPRACCDPSVAFDAYGNLFLSYLGADTNDAEVLLSTDGGQSFRLLASLPGHADQPTVATGGGSVWVAFEQTMAGRPPRNGKAARAINAGAVAYGAAVKGLGQVGRFARPESIAGPPGQNVADIAVGPAGQVLVTYASHTINSPSTIFVRIDPDGLGPRSFGPPIAVAQTNVTDFEPIPAQPRRTIDAEVGLAWDLSGDPFAGRVYLVYTDAPALNSTDTNIFVRYSDDNALTWSSPIRVNDDPTVDSQFFPRIAVDPTTGTVGLTWYDARNDTGIPAQGGGTDGSQNDEVQVYGAVGTPTAQGISFSPNFPVTRAFSNSNRAANPNDFGDYTGLAFFGGMLYPVWADNSNSTADNPDGDSGPTDLYAAIALVQTTPGPQPRTLVGEFGDISFGRGFLSHRLLIKALGAAPVSISVTHGRGYAFLDGGRIDLSLSGTTSASVLSIAGRGPAVLGDIIIQGSIRSILAPSTELAGTLSIAGHAGPIRLRRLTGIDPADLWFSP